RLLVLGIEELDLCAATPDRPELALVAVVPDQVVDERAILDDVPEVAPGEVLGGRLADRDRELAALTLVLALEVEVALKDAADAVDAERQADPLVGPVVDGVRRMEARLLHLRPLVRLPRGAAEVGEPVAVDPRERHVVVELTLEGARDPEEALREVHAL